MYESSLSLAFLLFFLISIALHAVTRAAEYSPEQAAHGEQSNFSAMQWEHTGWIRVCGARARRCARTGVAWEADVTVDGQATLVEARTLRQGRSEYYSAASSRSIERLGLSIPRDERRPVPSVASHWSRASRSSSGVSSQPLYDGATVAS